MRSTYTLMTAAGLTMAMAAGFALPAEAACTRLGFTVNDYGKDGPTRDAKNLLDKHIAKKMAERGVTKYNVGKKDVKCELFLDFVVFDEYTCTAEASVCWDQAAVTEPAAAKAAAKEPAESKKTAKSSESVSPAPEKASEDTAAAPKAEEPASQPAAESAAVSKPSESPSESPLAVESPSAAVEPTSSAPQAEKSSEASSSEASTAPEAAAPAAKKSAAPVEVYERVTEPVPGIDTP